MDAILNYELSPDDDFYQILGCDEKSTVNQSSKLAHQCTCLAWTLINISLLTALLMRGLARQTEQILAEYRAQVLHCHPDKTPGDILAAERFSRLQNAKETLSHPELRAKYDQWRHSGISMSYDQWLGLRDSVHMSMHWGTVKPKTMLADTSETVSQPPVQKTSPCHGQSTLHAHRDPSPSAEMPHLSPTTGQKKQPPWERDPPSPLLEKFRNYQV